MYRLENRCASFASCKVLARPSSRNFAAFRRPQFLALKLGGSILVLSAPKRWLVLCIAIPQSLYFQAGKLSPNYSFKQTAATGCATIMLRSAAAA